jgi:acetyl esterase/lipase
MAVKSMPKPQLSELPDLQEYKNVFKHNDHTQLHDNFRKYCVSSQALVIQQEHLDEGIEIRDFAIPASDGYQIKVREYMATRFTGNENRVLYYHGGGLKIGDLDSEDLTCRRMCIYASVIVYSIGYRLVPPEVYQAVHDTLESIIKAALAITNSIIGSADIGRELAGIESRVEAIKHTQDIENPD